MAECAPNASEGVFLKACRREATPYTPIWLMRQAGRYQKEFRAIRAKTPFLDLCKNPALATEVTVFAVEQLGVDAAIIFSDILVVVEPLGFKLEYVKGEGPVIHNPFTCAADLQRLGAGDAGELEYVNEALRMTRAALPPEVGLIGFAGSPFTVASYIIEGGKSKNYQQTKALMFEAPEVWDALLDKLVTITIDYLCGQVAAGAEVLQLFDSWVGVLSPSLYRARVLPHLKKLIAGLPKGVPVINFGTGNPALLPLFKEAGGDVIGLDWRVDLAAGWETLGDEVAVMGNLDPLVLFTSEAEIRQQAAEVLRQADGRPGHIFNLGHGMLPDMEPAKAIALVDAVHELSAR